MAKGPVARRARPRGGAVRRRRYAAALEELDAAFDTEPQNAAVFTARGWALENLGPERLAEARARLRGRAPPRPLGDVGQGGLANVLRRMGHVREADRLCEEVVDEGRRRYDAEEDLWELVGWCELRLGRYQDAVATLREALRRDGRWIAVRFDLALALLCAGERSRAFLEYSRGVHQAVNGGVERLRGCLRVALDDLEECLAERPALATTREAIAARDLLRSTLRAAYQAG